MKDFTILFPTRERPGMLVRLIQSIQETTQDLSRVEVLVGYDVDDRQTIQVLPRIDHPWAKYIGRPRGTNIQRDYHNWLYAQSCGRNIIIMNDDCLFKTKHWDSLANRKIEAYLKDKPDGIFYGWISDSLLVRSEGVNYCCFPMISRSAAKVLGWVMHPGFAGWGADIHLYQLFHAVGRVLDLREMWIDHISYHANKATRDSTSYNMQRISGITPVIDHNQDVPKLINAMRRGQKSFL